MANHDYISRTPAKKKKKNNTRRSRKPTNKAKKFTLKSKLISVVLLVLIAAFIYGLWSLKTDPQTKDPVTAPIKELKKQNTKTNDTPLPKKPEEKWTYQTKLKEQKIEVGEYEVKHKGPYQMQCGSFKTKEQANTLKAQIAFTGIESVVKTVTGKNGTWHKVILGPYPKKRLAEKDKHKLKRNNINYCQIWLWR